MTIILLMTLIGHVVAWDIEVLGPRAGTEGSFRSLRG